MPGFSPKYPAAVVGIAAAGVLAWQVPTQTDKEAKTVAHTELDQPAANVVRLAKRESQLADDLYKQTLITINGEYKLEAYKSEEPTPYPVVSVRGRKIGRILPYALPRPPYPSEETAKKILRYGREMTEREAEGFANFSDSSGPTPDEFINRNIVVRASTKNGMTYAANKTAFRRYVLLADAVTKGFKESKPKMEQDVVNAIDDTARAKQVLMSATNRYLGDIFPDVNEVAKINEKPLTELSYALSVLNAPKPVVVPMPGGKE